MSKYSKYYIVEIFNMNTSLGFIEYDHSSGGYPCLMPIYLANKFDDQYTAKEHAIRDIKTLASIKGIDIHVMSFKVLECGVIREVYHTSGGFYS